ncbi:hypothetical protein SmJEL517_g00832 [Synchytrium microbalum]|uniref:Deoxycytidylate deaminase n=1 Tax=Synchytrium microbalum TaxID=1806994 RepID=A0A507C6J5_9FUNG|nr:uncharacterized protein SmJEL517_g00832 [Synchytrium microbalum]TPX37210.1 hypothetical protein SmJEL517_g00832 [Synchytrium microbalum]
MRNRMEYCTIHDIHLVDLSDRVPEYNTSAQWARYFGLKELLAADLDPNHWLIWLDSDVLITNINQRFDQLIHTYGTGTTDLIISRDPSYKKWVGRNTSIVNSGVFLLLHSQWSRTFIDRMLDSRHARDGMTGLVDQRIMANILLEHENLKAKPIQPHETHEKVTVVENRELNGFCRPNQYYRGDVGLFSWKKGDFIAHLSSISRADRVLLLPKLVEYMGNEKATADDNPCLPPTMSRITILYITHVEARSIIYHNNDPIIFGLDPVLFLSYLMKRLANTTSHTSHLIDPNDAMLIALSGPPCSGKDSLISYLVSQHDFTHLRLPPPQHSSNRQLYNETDDTIAELCFSSAEKALEYILKKDWRKNYVLSPIERVVDALDIKRRPFALLVSVEAPTSLRYKRCRERCVSIGITPPTLDEFVYGDDQHMYGSLFISTPSSDGTITPPTSYDDDDTTLSTNLASALALSDSPRPNLLTDEAPPYSIYNVSSTADLHILNHHPTITSFHHHLASLDLLSPHRLRPTWDSYFMKMCDLAARRSNCMKRRVGCILVKENRVVATGYNGTPRGVLNCNQGGCPRCNDGAGRGVGLDECLCLHAEENALLEAGRARVEHGGSDSGAILYCNTCPCLGCAKKIIQVGVREVVFSQSYGMDELTEKLLSQAGVKLRQFAHEDYI